MIPFNTALATPEDRGCGEAQPAPHARVSFKTALETSPEHINIAPMKFLLAIVAYLVIAFVLGWGILLAVKGSPWLLVVGFVAYVVAVGKIGCLPKKSH